MCRSHMLLSGHVVQRCWMGSYSSKFQRCSRSDHNVFTICSRSVHDLFANDLRSAHNLLLVSALSTHDLLTTCFRCAHDVLMMRSRAHDGFTITSRWTYDLFLNYSWSDLLRMCSLCTYEVPTMCSGLPHDLLTTYIRFAHDLLRMDSQSAQYRLTMDSRSAHRDQAMSNYSLLMICSPPGVSMKYPESVHNLLKACQGWCSCRVGCGGVGLARSPPDKSVHDLHIYDYAYTHQQLRLFMGWPDRKAANLQCGIREFEFQPN